MESDVATALLTAAETELAIRYPEDIPTPIDLTGTGCRFLVAWWDGLPVACGGLCPFADEAGAAELQRMFVDARMRRQGIGRRLLRALLDAARDAGYTSVVLETGTRQPDAIVLCESEGFTPRACWGEYSNNPLSRCYEKKL